jgi:hypothetical protein
LTTEAELPAADTFRSDERRQKPAWPQVAMHMSELRRRVEVSPAPATPAAASVTPEASEPLPSHDLSGPQAPSLKPLRLFPWREDEVEVAAGV